ncbi:hypothetical protein GCM10022254_08720 [Actinomadura meridiana]|uniref:DUF3311 domain-containing protein n=1 Tax=Actinomadura meridiana TaxID=559626 RepID=A0ABP8BTI4_9ACTN
MAPDSPQDQNQDPPPSPPATRSDRSAWNWLLLLPIVVPLLTFVYNDEEPRLAGFPAFYWIQLSFILLGVASTVVVYRMTRKRG